MEVKYSVSFVEIGFKKFYLLRQYFLNQLMKAYETIFALKIMIILVRNHNNHWQSASILKLLVIFNEDLSLASTFNLLQIQPHSMTYSARIWPCILFLFDISFWERSFERNAKWLGVMKVAGYGLIKRYVHKERIILRLTGCLKSLIAHEPIDRQLVLSKCLTVVERFFDNRLTLSRW